MSVLGLRMGFFVYNSFLIKSGDALRDTKLKQPGALQTLQLSHFQQCFRLGLHEMQIGFTPEWNQQTDVPIHLGAFQSCFENMMCWVASGYLGNLCQNQKEGLGLLHPHPVFIIHLVFYLCHTDRVEFAFAFHE